MTSNSRSRCLLSTPSRHGRQVIRAIALGTKKLRGFPPPIFPGSTNNLLDSWLLRRVLFHFLRHRARRRSRFCRLRSCLLMPGIIDFSSHQAFVSSLLKPYPQRTYLGSSLRWYLPNDFLEAWFWEWVEIWVYPSSESSLILFPSFNYLLWVHRLSASNYNIFENGYHASFKQQQLTLSCYIDDWDASNPACVPTRFQTLQPPSCFLLATIALDSVWIYLASA